MKKYQSTVRSRSRNKDNEEDEKSEDSCNEPEFNSTNALLSINKYNVTSSTSQSNLIKDESLNEAFIESPVELSSSIHFTKKA